MSKIFNPQEKILCHIDTVEKHFKGKNPDPITLEIDPSNSCNHSCPFCISGHIHLKKYMGTKYFDRTILEKNIFDKLTKDLVKTNIKAINWTGGGEPTINPYFSKAINYIHNNSKIEMGMFSNGSLFERFNLFEDIVKCLKWVRISIDAGEEKTYNSLRQTNKSNDFNTVIKNIKKLIQC